MLFEEHVLCAPAYCREIYGVAAHMEAAPFSVALVSSGHAQAQAGGTSAELCAGEMLLTANTPLALIPAGECHALAAGFTGAAAQAASEKLLRPLRSDCAVCPMAAQLLGELSGAIGRVAASEISALSYHILCALAHADEAAPHLPPLAADAVLAIRQNYAGLYGVEELSAQLGVSKSHLVRVFSAALGQTPGQYLTQVRVEAAKSLLARREYTLEVIATLCGFSGANYLCKVFKKHTGQTPAAYRASCARTQRADTLNELERALYI